MDTYTSVSGAASATFVYDGDGNRVKGTVNGTTTTYLGNYFEWTGSTTTMNKYYYAGATRVAMRHGSSSISWLFSDHLGSMAITATYDGTVTGELRYKAWGETRYSYGTTPTTYQFTGQRKESYINLYWYGSRWYDPVLGRWIQPDSIIPDPNNPADWDRYSYVRNNPLIYCDSSGHWPEFNWTINTTDIIQGAVNWALNATSLSNLGVTTNDVASVLSTGGTVVACLALAVDTAAVDTVAAITIIGTSVGGPVVSYLAGEVAVAPLIYFGNILATEATLSTAASESITGDLGANLSIQANDNGISINGEISIGGGTSVGLITTLAGWFPGEPSWVSFGIQTIAVANDLDLLDVTNITIPIDY